MKEAIASLKQSHNAISHNSDPGSRNLKMANSCEACLAWQIFYKMKEKTWWEHLRAGWINETASTSKLYDFQVKTSWGEKYQKWMAQTEQKIEELQTANNFL